MRKRNYKEYQNKMDDKNYIINDETFINNLFLMARTKRHEFKMLIKSLKIMNVNRISQFVKSYGISDTLVRQIIEIINKDNDIEVEATLLEEFLTTQHENSKNKENI